MHNALVSIVVLRVDNQSSCLWFLLVLSDLCVSVSSVNVELFLLIMTIQYGTYTYVQISTLVDSVKCPVGTVLTPKSLMPYSVPNAPEIFARNERDVVTESLDLRH